MKCVGDFVYVSVRAGVGKALAVCFFLFYFRVLWVVIVAAMLILIFFNDLAIAIKV